jgi:hypothetical protein
LREILDELMSLTNWKRVRMANYNNVLTLGVSRRGLYLASMFVFRFMHPPLLVPWSVIKVRRNKGWVFEYVTFTMGHELVISLRIRGEAGSEVARVGWHLLAH